MRSFFSFIIIACAFTASAQTDSAYSVSSTIFSWFDPTQLHLSDSGKVSVHFGSEFLVGSSAQPVSFTDKLLFGGYIDNEEKDNVSKRLKDLNYGGVDFESDFYISFKTDSLCKNSAIFFGGGYNYFQSLAYTRDFFNIAFYGNKLYAGDTATFSKSAFSGYSLVEYKAGFVKQFPVKKGNLILGIAGGFVQGLSANDANIHQGILATAPDGEYLDIAMDFEYNNSGNAPVSYNNTEGTGYSFDVFTKFQNTEKRFEIIAGIQDIGMMYWNNTPNNYIADTNYIFDGIDITYVFNASGSNSDGSNDSIFDILGIDTTHLPFRTVTPAKLNLSFTKYFSGNNIFINAGAQYYLFTPYQIYIYGRFGKNFINQSLQISGIVNVGGFGGFGIGVDVEKKLFNSVFLRVGSNSILGFIAPNTFNTASVFGTIKKTF